MGFGSVGVLAEVYTVKDRKIINQAIGHRWSPDENWRITLWYDPRQNVFATCWDFIDSIDIFRFYDHNVVHLVRNAMREWYEYDEINKVAITFSVDEKGKPLHFPGLWLCYHGGPGVSTGWKWERECYDPHLLAKGGQYAWALPQKFNRLTRKAKKGGSS